MNFDPNPRFLEQLAEDPEVKRALEDKAQEALGAAEEIGRSIAETGGYADSLEVDGVRILTTDPAGHLIEWGSVNNPAHAPLRKAVEQVGARYEDTGRG